MIIDPNIGVPILVGTSVVSGVACYGVYYGSRANTGLMENAFTGKGMLAFWVLLTSFLSLLFALPMPYAHLLHIPYVAVLVGLSLYCNRKSQQLREIDSNNPT